MSVSPCNRVNWMFITRDGGKYALFYYINMLLIYQNMLLFLKNTKIFTYMPKISKKEPIYPISVHKSYRKSLGSQ